MEAPLGRMDWKSVSTREYIWWAFSKLIRLDMHCLLSLPIFILISIIIAIQFCLYCFIKLCVRFSEEMYFRYASITTKNIYTKKNNNNISDLPISLKYQKRKMFEESKSYSEYATYAEKLDKITRRNLWKEKISSHDYDYNNICKKIQLLRLYKNNKDVENLVHTLRNCLQAKGGGILKESLYSRTYIGTKKLIDEYINEICSSLDMLGEIYLYNNMDVCSSNNTISYQRHPSVYNRNHKCCLHSQNNNSCFFSSTPSSPSSSFTPSIMPLNEDAFIKISIRDFQSIWGNTALFLSGGAMLGIHHIGLCEVLIKNSVEVIQTKISQTNSPAKQNLLPKIICGTSAGSVVAAWICTRSDEEICKEVDNNFISTAFQALRPNNWFLRFWNILKKGYMCDVDYWVTISTRLYGHMTFLEAYEKTGRVLNITMTRADRNDEDTVILNYKNAPNIVIFTAVLASSSFPFLGLPVHLKEKNELGDLRDSLEYEGAFFHDGSLSNDIPLKSIHDFWTINFTVVSQVNLHIFPFTGFRAHGEAGLPINWRGSAGKWRAGFLMSALELFLKENMRFLLRLIAVLDVSPTYRGINCASIISQSYTGDVTIHPPRLSWRHIKFANDLNQDDTQWYINLGRKMAYPKLSLIINRMKIDRALQRVANVLSLRNTPSQYAAFSPGCSPSVLFLPSPPTSLSCCTPLYSSFNRNNAYLHHYNMKKSDFCESFEEEEKDIESTYNDSKKHMQQCIIDIKNELMCNNSNNITKKSSSNTNMYNNFNNVDCNTKNCEEDKEKLKNEDMQEMKMINEEEKTINNNENTDLNSSNGSTSKYKKNNYCYENVCDYNTNINDSKGKK